MPRALVATAALAAVVVTGCSAGYFIVGAQVHKTGAPTGATAIYTAQAVTRCLNVLTTSIAELDRDASLEQVRIGPLTVAVPAYRNDIMHPIDLCEDVAIAYGYHNITPSLVPSMTVGGEQPLEGWAEIARRAPMPQRIFEVGNVTFLDEAAETGARVPFFFKQWGGVNKKRAGAAGKDLGPDAGHHSGSLSMTRRQRTRRRSTTLSVQFGCSVQLRPSRRAMMPRPHGGRPRNAPV